MVCTAIRPVLGLVLVSVGVVVVEHEKVAEEDEAVGQLGEAQEKGEDSQRRLCLGGVGVIGITRV